MLDMFRIVSSNTIAPLDFSYNSFLNSKTIKMNEWKNLFGKSWNTVKMTFFSKSVIFNVGLVNKWSLLFQKRTQGWFFGFFHFWFFVAFNSRDMTMLWVLNLFSRSSPTKLWKRIFDLRSQKKFFDAWRGLVSPKL